MTIRAATTADIPTMAALESASFDAYVLKPDQLRRLIASRNVVLVSEEDGTVIGHAVVLLRRTLRAGQSARLYSLVVSKHHRGQGIGRALLQECLAMCDALRPAPRWMSLEVESTNDAAIAMYRLFGFADVETIADYYGPKRAALRMRRVLPRG